MSTSALAAASAALGGDEALLDNLTIRGPRAILASPLAVGDHAIACTASALLAASQLAEARGQARPAVTLDAQHVAASFTSERHLRIDGHGFGAGFAPLSTWLQTADGWLRSHANYPHHRAALLAALQTREDLDAVSAAAATRQTEELEEAIFAAGGCAGAVRERAAWEAHPAGRAIADSGLLDLTPGRLAAAPLTPLNEDDLPATGIRVLDLTRVIAGPVAGRTLAALGAEVLRIDAPGLLEIEASAVDTGPGKRSALLDLRDSQRTFHELLSEADVLIEGYRPGALDAIGFGTRALAERYPNLVTASLSAWGDEGPWGRRRGFDSLVQAVTGIAVACTPEGAVHPGALPAQALDHGTGHLIAAAVLRGLTERTRTGRPLHARFALARTARWLLELPTAPEQADTASPKPADPDGYRIEYPYREHTVSLIAPPGELDGRPLRWLTGPEPIGSSPAAWSRPPHHGPERASAEAS